jgi:dihydropteroate synthase
LRDPETGVEELDVTTPREVERHLERVGSAADPGAGVARVFRLDDLDESERDALGDLATEYPGVTVAVGETAALVLGTDAALGGFTDETSPALGERLAAIERAL